MDTTPPMVVVSCLIAEVDLSGTEEFGVELGLQNPLEFVRGLLPGSTNAVTYTTAIPASATGFVPAGSVVSSQPYGVPGFNFNDPNALPGNNTSISPNGMAYQALSSLGVGRTSSNVPGVSGFVFSSAQPVDQCSDPGVEGAGADHHPDSAADHDARQPGRGGAAGDVLPDRVGRFDGDHRRGDGAADRAHPLGRDAPGDAAHHPRRPRLDAA